MPNGRKHGGCEGSIKKQVQQKLKPARKLFNGNSLVPDFKILSLASVIKPDFVEQEFLISKHRNINSLCHKR